MSENLVNCQSLIELRKENDRLLAQVLYQEKCIKLLENYRNYLLLFCNNCRCDQNTINKSVLSQLEINYKSFNTNNSENQVNHNVDHNSLLNCVSNNEHLVIGHKNHHSFINQFTQSEFVFSNHINCENIGEHLNRSDGLVTVKTEDDLSTNMNMCFDVFPANTDLEFGRDQSNNALLSGEQPLLNSNQSNTSNDKFVFGSNLFGKRKNNSKRLEVSIRDPKVQNIGQLSSLITNPTPRTGRNQENLIHTYYDYNPETDRCLCKVINCNKEIKGKKPTNLQKHLQSFHKTEYKIYLRDEENRKIKKMKLEEEVSNISQSNTIPTSILLKKFDKYYDENNPVAKGFLLRLIKLVSMTSVAVSIVELKEFREIILFLDKRISIPSSLELKNQCQNYLIDSKQEIRDKIQVSDNITLVSDIISLEEMSKFFIRVVAYMYDKSDNVKNVLTLGLRSFPKPHKVEQIIEKIQVIIQEYDISHEKIIRVVTDNGSDLCQTFKIECLAINRSFYESDDQLIQKSCDTINQKALNDTEFNEQELDLNLQFYQKFSITRIDSIVHIILCSIKTCEIESPFGNVIKKMDKVMKNICELMDITENQFLSIDINHLAIPTTWNLLYQQLKCFYDKKEDIESICLENGFQCLEPGEWDAMQELVDLYKPFDEITIDLSKESETTISKVFSSYLFLKHQLLIKSKKESGSESLKSMTNQLTIELENRFDKMLDPNHNDFNDGIYLASTFLDPRFARLLNEKQLKSAKAFLRQFYNQFVDKELPTTESVESFIEESKEQKTSFESFMETELSRMSSRSSNKMFHFDKQFVDWLHFVNGTRISLNTDPLDFWRNDSSTQSYCDLKNIALNLLCIPSTTVTIERLLSDVANKCFDQMNSFSETQLEMITFFKSNAKYLKTLSSFE